MSSWESASDRLSILTALGGETAVVYAGPFGEAAFGESPFGGSADVVGILERGFVDVQGIECEAPLFTCRTADLAGLTHGMAVLVNGTDYLVRGIRPDGTGMTVLVLEEQ